MKLNGSTRLALSQHGYEVHLAPASQRTIQNRQIDTETTADFVGHSGSTYQLEPIARWQFGKSFAQNVMKGMYEGIREMYCGMGTL